jgi:hypothetical protein
MQLLSDMDKYHLASALHGCVGDAKGSDPRALAAWLEAHFDIRIPRDTVGEPEVDVFLSEATARLTARMETHEG